MVVFPPSLSWLDILLEVYWATGNSDLLGSLGRTLLHAYSFQCHFLSLSTKLDKRSKAHSKHVIQEDGQSTRNRKENVFK